MVTLALAPWVTWGFPLARASVKLSFVEVTSKLTAVELDSAPLVPVTMTVAAWTPAMEADV
jgi:hypothetical protein